MKQVVIFGGTGFIGTHLTQRLLGLQSVEKIVLVDMQPPREEPYTAALTEGMRSGRVSFFAHDLRQPVPTGRFPAPDLIFNLAAVHREPGHAAHEYYETNLHGAENACAYAEAVGCQRMVFTSSISPYGPSEEAKDETSLPVPETAYGGSKLVAEKMHMGWQKGENGRRLLILRPGVVYGPGEGGNVTRLIRSVVKGYFAYMGNRKTLKAGGYVKELCEVILFGLHHQETAGEGVTLLNFSLDPPRTLEQFVEAIRAAAGKTRKPISVPRSLLLGVSYPVEAAARMLSIRQPISPVRVKKLARSTNVEPTRLRILGYRFHYDFDQTFADWKRDKPEDFE